MRPILFQTFSHHDAKRGAEWIEKEKPAEWYLYSHLGSWEGTVATLRRHRHRVIRRVNLLHAHDEAAEWTPLCFERYMWDLALWNNLFLKSRTGELVRFPWFGNGPVYNLCKITPQIARVIAHFLKPRRDLFLDQCWLRAREWMFLDEELRIRDLADYSHLRWTRGLQLIARSLGWPRRRKLMFNGEDALHRQNFLMMFENADTGNKARHLWRTVGWWQKTPGSVLGLEAHPRQVHIRKIVDEWLRRGGALWLGHPAAHSYALKRRAGR